ncbi:hypothetical protein MTO96_008359 [Rhipicephalus appendiculatus]
MIADKLASSDVVIVHVGTTVDSVNVCMDKYRQLAQGIIEHNPMLHVAFSAVLPQGQNQYRPREAELSDACHFNGHYRNVNASLTQFCLERGFTFLDGLVDSWPGCLSRDGVHPSQFSNNVLADFLHQQAYALSIHLERRRIQQSYKEFQNICMEWVGSAREHRRHLGGRFSCTWFAYSSLFSSSMRTFHCTSSCLENQQCSHAETRRRPTGRNRSWYWLHARWRWRSAVHCKGSKAWRKA